MSKKDEGDLNQPKYSALDLVKLYESEGKTIFPRSLWKGVSSVAGLTDEIYPHKGLEQVLTKYFKDDTLSSGLTKTLITSYDIENREPLFFKSWKSEHQSVFMKHAARATSAAPTYFEPALLTINGQQKALVDGGIFINSPAVSAYAEAKKIFPDEKEFFVLSLGTGELIRKIPFSEAKDWGKAEWLVPLLNCMFDGVSDATNYQMEMFLGNGYIRLQTDLSDASDDMDNTTYENIQHLKAEAKKLISTRAIQIDQICQLLNSV